MFYEPIPSEIRYIQRRGRTGRKTAGRVVILAAQDTNDMIYLYAAQNRVERMKEHGAEAERRPEAGAQGQADAVPVAALTRGASARFYART